jgi:hypothetical protein
MAFTLEEIHPWGRSFHEYRNMFSLSESDLKLKLIGCADGPASFNAEATQVGSSVVSCDPLYACSAEDIRARIDQTYDRILGETRRNESEFLWDNIKSVEDLGRIRWNAMAAFLSDFSSESAAGRYVGASLPALPFSDKAFDIALCSHFLFLYSNHLTEEFHLRAISEMCRVAAEARVFPLLSLDSRPSDYVEPVCAELKSRGFAVSIERVPYEFQRGGNRMLRVRR